MRPIADDRLLDFFDQTIRGKICRASLQHKRRAGNQQATITGLAGQGWNTRSVAPLISARPRAVITRNASATFAGLTIPEKSPFAIAR